MVTGASTANLSIVLVDARQGVIEQTRRHTFIAAMLGIPHLVIAINKMDLVDWKEERFQEIRDEIEDFLPKLDVFRDVKFIPISALNGDNVVDASKYTPWYAGPTLARASGNRPHRERLESQRVSLPGAMGESPEQSDGPYASRLSRPERPDRRAASCAKASKSRCCPACIKTTIKEIWTYDGSSRRGVLPAIRHDLSRT